MPGMRMFLARAVLLSAPLAIALATYVAYDPFRVLRHYDFGDYYDDAAPVELNRDYVSLQLFRKYNPTARFDSFILGSSRSFPIHCDAWARHLSGGRAFHYPAAAGNIYGIAKKRECLENSGVRIENALVEVTSGLPGAEPRGDGMHCLPYELTGESWLEFQAIFVKTYFSEFYFLKYIAYAYTGKQIGRA